MQSYAYSRGELALVSVCVKSKGHVNTATRAFSARFTSPSAPRLNTMPFMT